MNLNVRFSRAVVVAVFGLGFACNTGVLDPSGNAISSVTVSRANPTDGNGALDPATFSIQHYTNVGVQHLDKVTIAGLDATGTIEHDFEIFWLPATGEVTLLQHFWTPVGGATSGSTRCAAGTANACNPAAISVNAEQRYIDLNGIVLLDLFGGDATSTLSGTVVWSGDLDGGDH